MMTRGTALFLGIVICSLANAQDQQQPNSTSVVYKTVGDKLLFIDVLVPPVRSPAEKRPAIVFFHGGGWVGGSPRQFAKQTKHFQTRGIVCFLVQYRLLDKGDQSPPTICIEDARDAFRFVQSHADEYSIDTERIAGAGGSAGGHLAAACGMIDVEGKPFEARPKALMLFNPVYDNGPGQWGAGRVGERFPEFSPAHNISSDDPPTIVFFGTKDKLVTVETAQAFQKKMQNVGVRSDLVLYEGAGHGFFNTDKPPENYQEKTLKAADDFLVSLEWLKPLE
ncbi:alpha/beta hydrolase [Lacunimicrobium album]